MKKGEGRKEEKEGKERRFFFGVDVDVDVDGKVSRENPSFLAWDGIPSL